MSRRVVAISKGLNTENRAEHRADHAYSAHDDPAVRCVFHAAGSARRSGITRESVKAEIKRGTVTFVVPGAGSIFTWLVHDFLSGADTSTVCLPGFTTPSPA
jgi:hypothetical protein